MFGWHDTVITIAKNERVSTDEVYQFSAVRFLNCVAYVKYKQLYEKEINEQFKNKSLNAVTS